MGTVAILAQAILAQVFDSLILAPGFMFPKSLELLQCYPLSKLSLLLQDATAYLEGVLSIAFRIEPKFHK